MVTKLEAQGKQIFQWGEKFVDIATLEKAVYEAVLSLGAQHHAPVHRGGGPDTRPAEGSGNVPG